jgi:hypothetical protein
MLDIKDVIRNIETIYGSNSSLKMLKDFERVVDELDCYVYENWIDGELVEGPKESRYWVSCKFMWPHKKMPNPIAAKRLTDYGCRINYSEESISKVRKIRTPGDIRPGTRKGKIDQVQVWIVEIAMPKKLMHDIDQGYKELDQNKIDDALDQRAGMQLEQDNVEQQVQDIQNAQPEAAAPAA